MGHTLAYIHSNAGTNTESVKRVDISSRGLALNSKSDKGNIIFELTFPINNVYDITGNFYFASIKVEFIELNL